MLHIFSLNSLYFKFTHVNTSRSGFNLKDALILKKQLLFICLFVYLYLFILGFELRALHLLGRCSTT
jgi:hypothetical protein